MMRVCSHCGNAFQRPKGYSEAQWASAMFCSRRCMGDRRKSERPALQRFFYFIKVDPTTRCWNWTGAKDGNGYGLFDGERAHRFIFKSTVADIPDGHFVLHRCDNPSCANPFHLFCGTHQDNMDDMFLKGRGRRAIGEAAGGARLTSEDVERIRLDQRLQREIAADYGIAQTTVSAIKRSVTWKHIAR